MVVVFTLIAPATLLRQRGLLFYIMQCKMFFNDEFLTVQDEINEWLTDNPHIRVREIKQSSLQTENNNGDAWLVVTLFYDPPQTPFE